MAIHNPVSICGTDSSGESEDIDITSGAAHVALMDSSGTAISNLGDFTPLTASGYTGKVTTDGTGVATAVATGATRLLLQSLEVTGLEEFAVLAFGTSGANATSNLNVAASVGTTGLIIPSGDSTAGGVAIPMVVGVPSNATHFSMVDGVSGLAQVIMVTQGT